MSGIDIQRISDEAGRRWDMSRTLGCRPETVDVYAHLFDAAMVPSIRISGARRRRTEARKGESS